MGCVDSVERNVSPLGNLELVIKKRDCGATTSEVRKIYVVEKDQKLSFFDRPLLLVERFQDLQIVWNNENNISVNYSKAKIHEFKNFWRIFRNGNIIYEVELVLNKKLR